MATPEMPSTNNFSSTIQIRWKISFSLILSQRSLQILHMAPQLCSHIMCKCSEQFDVQQPYFSNTHFHQSELKWLWDMQIFCNMPYVIPHWEELKRQWNVPSLQYYISTLMTQAWKPPRATCQYPMWHEANHSIGQIITLQRKAALTSGEWQRLQESNEIFEYYVSYVMNIHCTIQDKGCKSPSKYFNIIYQIHIHTYIYKIVKHVTIPLKYFWMVNTRYIEWYIDVISYIRYI